MTETESRGATDEPRETGDKTRAIAEAKRAIGLLKEAARAIENVEAECEGAPSWGLEHYMDGHDNTSDATFALSSVIGVLENDTE